MHQTVKISLRMGALAGAATFAFALGSGGNAIAAGPPPLTLSIPATPVSTAGLIVVRLSPPDPCHVDQTGPTAGRGTCIDVGPVAQIGLVPPDPIIPPEPVLPAG